MVIKNDNHNNNHTQHKPFVRTKIRTLPLFIKYKMNPEIWDKLSPDEILMKDCCQGMV